MCDQGCQYLSLSNETMIALHGGQLTPFEEHLLADLHTIARQVAEMHAMMQRFAPLLAVLDPGGQASDLQRAGTIRGLRKAMRNGG